MTESDLLTELDSVLAKAVRFARSTNFDMILGTHLAAAIVADLDDQGVIPDEVAGAILRLATDIQHPQRQAASESTDIGGPEAGKTILRPISSFRVLAYSKAARDCISELVSRSKLTGDPKLGLLKSLLRRDVELRSSLRNAGHDPDALARALPE